MPNALKCPLCGSRYSTDESGPAAFSAGDVCGNRAMTGPNPDACSPEHPCPGILVPVPDDAEPDSAKLDVERADPPEAPFRLD
jgi:hypothetical protein